MPYTLREYQQKAVTASLEAYDRGVNKQLWVMATGLGKTVAFAALASIRNSRTLYVAHTDRLIRQTVDTVKEYVPIQQMGIVKADENRHYAKHVIGSIHSLAQPKRLGQIAPFDTIIVDEAHHSPAKNYRRAIAALCHEKTLLLGVTATADRADGVGLDSIYDEIVFEMGLLQGIEEKHLCELSAIQIRVPIDLSRIRTARNEDGERDYREEDVVLLMDQSNWVEIVTTAWKEHASKRLTMAFVPRVAQAYDLAQHMRSRGIRAAALDGAKDEYTQRKVIGEFERRELDVLINCELFSEGANIPATDCVMMCAPTRSRARYSQRAGRVTRQSPATGKLDGLILDMVGVTNDLNLCTAASLIGTREVRQGETLRDARQREHREDDQLVIPVEEFDGQLDARHVDLFIEAGERRRRGEFVWLISRQTQQSVLIVRGHRFEIWKNPGEWHYNYADMLTFGGLQGTTFDYKEAESICEERAHEIIHGGKDAPWRRDPATKAQLALLKRYGVAASDSLTKSDASRLIRQAIVVQQTQLARPQRV